MSVPFLFDIASQLVAQNLSKGKYDNVDFELSQIVSNAVFRELRRDPFPSEKVALVVGEKLNVTEVDLQEQTMDQNDVRFLLKQNGLQVLKLGYTEDLEDVGERDYENTARILAVCVNEHSRKTLRHVTFTWFECPERLWANEMRNMSRRYTNLVSLDFAEIELEDKFIATLCAHLPNLKCLDVSSTRLTSLVGISNLSQLEKLNIDSLELEDGFRELCQLERLRVLDFTKGDFGRMHACLMQLVEEGVKPFPSLQEMDCTSTDLAEHMLPFIQTCIPSLRLICSVNTPLDYTRLELLNLELTILNGGSLEGFAKCLEYYEKREKKTSIKYLFADVKQSAQFEWLARNLEEVELRREMIRKISEAVIRLYVQDEIGFMVWNEGHAIMNALCSPAFFDHLTRVELNALFNLYQTSIRELNEEDDFWEFRQFHEFYWTCLSELCKRSTLQVLNLKEILIQTMSILTRTTERRVLSLVYSFYQEVFQNAKYSKLYYGFLGFLNKSVEISMHFCKKYAEREMIEPLFFNLNFDFKTPEEAHRIQMAHLKILKEIVTSLRGTVDLAHFCQDSIISNLLRIITDRPIPFDRLQHHVFTILWIVITNQGAHVNLELRRLFDGIIMQRPLKASLVRELIEHHEDGHLIAFVGDE